MRASSERWILHIDMDAFYASVEQLDHPHLKGQPVIVGGDPRRGVVSAASYEARRFGIHSAMPMFQALQKCPQAVIMRSRMDRYQQVSRQILGLLRLFSPLVEPVSIDEAYLDLSGCERLHGSPAQLARRIKKCLYETVPLTCSIGVAPNKFLAKIASDLDKPDGITLIDPEQVESFVARLPVTKVPGVGRVMAQNLQRMGVTRLGDLKHYPRKGILHKFGKFGERLLTLAAGQDPSPVEPYSPPKSISSESTLRRDTLDTVLLEQVILRHAEAVGRELRCEQLQARTVTLKIKHADFRRVTRSQTLAHPTQSSKRIDQAATTLWRAYGCRQKVRLIGVGTSGLVPEQAREQLELFESSCPVDRKWQQVDATLDTIAQKYGRHVIQKASLRRQKK